MKGLVGCRAGRVATVLAGLWLLLAPLAHALEMVDDRGVRVMLAQSPQRIVSVLPSLTETVCALGRCSRLVGVDRYSNFPESVRKLPRVGGGLDPSIEAIVALRPDLVLLAASSPAAARLESLGLKVVALEPKNYADGIEAGVDAATRSLAPSIRGKRIYFEVNSGPYAAGADSFLGETLTRLGVVNIVPAGMGPFPKINPEFVVRADPDLIMVGDTNFAGMKQRPGWSNMRAIRYDRVCVFPPAQSDVMVRPGPRMAEAARAMALCLSRHLP